MNMESVVSSNLNAVGYDGQLLSFAYQELIRDQKNYIGT